VIVPPKKNPSFWTSEYKFLLKTNHLMETKTKKAPKFTGSSKKSTKKRRSQTTENLADTRRASALLNRSASSRPASHTLLDSGRTKSNA